MNAELRQRLRFFKLRTIIENIKLVATERKRQYLVRRNENRNEECKSSDE